MSEFTHIRLKRTKKAIKCLLYYPERASFIAKQASHPILQGFFYENFIDWESYEETFWNEVNDFFKPFDDEKRFYEKAKEEMKEILPEVKTKMGKEEAVAEHDAYLISLVRLLRKARPKDIPETWFRYFKYIDWIATHDVMFRTFDRHVGEKSDPVSFLVSYLPLYYHPYFMAKAIGGDFELGNFYDLLYDTSFLLEADDKAEERYRSLDKTSQSIAGIKDPDQLTEMLVTFTNATLAKMDETEDFSDGNA